MSENQHIEWKESWRAEYLKWVCAFANAQGGAQEIGRDTRGRVVGFTDAAKLMEELPNKMRDLLGIVADVDLLEEGGKPYVRITVEPYPYPVSYKGEYHVRSGSTKQMLKGAALDRFLLSRTGKRWDAVPLPGVSVGDLDAGVLVRFRERAAKSKRLGADVLEEDDTGLSNHRSAMRACSGWKLRSIPLGSTTQETAQETLVKTPERILEVLGANPRLRLAEVAGMIGKSLSAVERASAKLVREGRLRYVGPRKGGHWEILGEDDE